MFLVPNSGTQLDAPSLAPRELPALEMRRLVAESSPSYRWDATAHPSPLSLCGSCGSAGPSGLHNGLPTSASPLSKAFTAGPGSVWPSEGPGVLGDQSSAGHTVGERTSRVCPQQAARYARGDATVM